MKTLNLENRKGKLSRIEMKNIVGGKDQPALMSCSCSGAANPPYNSSWADIYNNANDIASAISSHCANGGSCNPTTIF